MLAMRVSFMQRATSIISQISVDRSQQLISPNPVISVPGGFQSNVPYRAVRVKCLARGLLWPLMLVESRDRRFIEDRLREDIFPVIRALHRGLLAGTYLGVLDSLLHYQNEGGLNRRQ